MTTLREYYNSIGISEETLNYLNKELSIANIGTYIGHYSARIKRDMLSEAKDSTYNHEYIEKEIHESRKANIDNIKKWKGKLEIYYSEEDIIVGAIKPGKEAAVDYKLNHSKKCKCEKCRNNNRSPVKGDNRSPNIHDMLPVIIENNRNLATKISFGRENSEKNNMVVKRYTPWTIEQICRPLEHLFMQKFGRFGLEIIGTVLFRSAFNLDHENENGKWRLKIPPNALDTIERILPNKKMKFSDGDVPMEFSVSSFLYFFDILGINEDIKVHAKGRVNDFMEPVTWKQYDQKKEPSKIVLNGRTNTLLTYCQIISIMLSRDSVGLGMRSYQRGMGMCPLDIKRAKDYFPLLSSDFSQILDKDIQQDLDWKHG